MGKASSAVLALALLAASASAAQAESSKLPAPAPLRIDLADKAVMIVAPQGAAYARAAADLIAAIKERSGNAPRLLADTAPISDMGVGPMILLGNLMDSAAIRRLYFGCRDFTDYAFPSPGGFVVRTVHDPLGTGGHVVILGGSDAEGVRLAAKWLADYVGKNGPELGYVNIVKLGKFAKEIRGPTEAYLTMPTDKWPRVGGSGSWDYMIAIAKTGVGYLRTGDEAYLPIFKREMDHFLRHDVHNPTSDAPRMLHGFVWTLLVVWDLIRDHPSFTQRERSRIDEAFLHIARSDEGPKRLTSARRRNVIRGNHGTRSALDAHFLGRFFHQRFGLPEAQAWLDTARDFFAPQMRSAKPLCDSWGHQWSASLLNTLLYAMATGDDAFFQSSACRRGADRAVIAHGDAGPSAYLAACESATGNTGYLSLEMPTNVDDHARRRAALSRSGDEYLRAFCTGRPISAYKDLLGVAVAPVAELWHKTIDKTGSNPGGLYANTVPPDQCFDKAGIRDRFGPDGYYLLFDGIGGGHHAYQDVNCIVWYRQGGVCWWKPPRKFTGSMTVREQNGVFVALNAEGPGRVHRYSRLLYAGKKGDHFALAGRLDGLGPVDWERHILRKTSDKTASGWTLVIDRFLPKAKGQLIAERFWHVAGDIEPRRNGLVGAARADGKDVFLHLQSAGSPSDGMTGTKPRVERLLADVNAGACVEMATLLTVSSTRDNAGHTIKQTPEGWRVTATEDGAVATVSVATDADGHRGLIVSSAGTTTTIAGPSFAGQALDQTTERSKPARLLPVVPKTRRVSLSWKELLPRGKRKPTAVAVDGGFVAVGTESGLVHLIALGKNGTYAERWHVRLPSRIRSLHVLAKATAPSASPIVLVGEERGAISHVDADGKIAWTVEIPYTAMPWTYWSEYRSRIREIDAADVTGDGVPEILLSNSDRRVYAFSLDGKELWKRPVEWGIFTAMTVGTYKDKPAIFGGTSQPSIHGRCIVLGVDGKIRGHLGRPDIVSWSVPSSLLDMRIADVNGDGTDEIVTALDTNCRQLIAYDQDGKIKWDADMAGAVDAVAIDAKRSRVICTSRCGYVVALDGKNGRRFWSRRLGQVPGQIWLAGDGRVLAPCRSGKVFVLDESGNLEGSDDLGGEVTALLRPGDHRVAGRPLVVGIADGRSLLVPCDR